MDISTWRDLRRGLSGEDVREWQVVLATDGFLLPGDADDQFGPKTEKATVSYQIAHGLKADGIVGPSTRATIGAPEPTPVVVSDLFDSRWRFLQAQNYTKVTGIRSVSLVPMHTMQAPDRPDTAEGVASWFSGARGPAPQASSHVCGDVDSIVQCVKPNDIAWGVQGGNSISYNCEQGGYAEWTRDEWLGPVNLPMLKLMASHVRLALDHFRLPLVVLTEAEVANCVRDALIAQGKLTGARSGTVGGICEHRDLTQVWQQWQKYGLPNPRAGAKPFWPTHVDCGDGYPIDVLLDLVKASAP